MGARIYLLSGGSGSGKTALLNMILSDPLLNAASPPKYSNRRKRNKADDIITVSERDFNKDEYTFVYAMNNNIYAYKAGDIIEILKKGKNVFLIISDLRLIDDVKKYFGSYVSVLYVFRNMTEQELKKILLKREKDNNEKKDRVQIEAEKRIRINRLYLIQRQYIENITLFDHVILNRTQKTEEMLTQVKHLLQGYEKGHTNLKPRGPVIFLIAAASGAGKRTLTDAMYTLGKKSIKVVEKATDRAEQEDDGPEIITNKEINNSVYDISYEFNGNMYGFKSTVIWDNLKEGHPQILITNMDNFSQFKEKFGKAAISVYLHATRTKSQIYKWQISKLKSRSKALQKVKKMEVIHQGYIDNICDFNHVLLNTVGKEDLWEQMFRLIKFYQP